MIETVVHQYELCLCSVFCVLVVSESSSACDPSVSGVGRSSSGVGSASLSVERLTERSQENVQVGKKEKHIKHKTKQEKQK